MKRAALIELLVLFLTAWAWADVTITATANYWDAAGYRYSSRSNTLSIATPILLKSALPTPILNLPNRLPVDTILIAGYPVGYNVSFRWAVIPAAATALPPSQSSPSSAGPATAASFTTATNAAPLAAYALAPGDYQVSVIAQDSNGNTSLPAQASVTLVVSNASLIRVYPNPWRIDKHAGFPITFDNLPLGSTVKIFTVSGHWIRTLTTSAATVTWDRNNDAGEQAASGIYLYLVTDNQGNKTHGKITIIK
jgi:hypothetical protein